MTFRQNLSKLRDFLVEQHFRLLIGIQLLTIINFVLLVVAASDKIQTIIPLAAYYLLIIMVPAALIGVWLFGLFMDKVIKYPTTFYKTQTNRNPQIMEVLNIVKKIEKKIEEEKQ